MKKLNLLSLIALVLILISTSCSIEKLSLSSNHQNRWKHGSKKVELVKYENLRSEKIVVNQIEDTIEIASQEKEEIKTIFSNSLDNPIIDKETIIPNQDFSQEEAETFSKIITTIEETKDTIPNKKEECDLIILQNGDEINGKVTEVGIEEIRYLKCDNLSGPTYILKKSDVFIIKYSNGNKDIFKEDNKKNEVVNSSDRTVHGFATTSFISALVGLIILPVIFGPLGLIFGMAAITKINNKPNKFKGITLAAIGIVISLVNIVFAFIMLTK